MHTPESQPAAPDELRQAVSAVIGVPPEEIPGDANLVFLGLGSLELMRLVTRWRRAGLAVDFAALTAEPTLDAWAAQYAAAAADRGARPAGAER